MSQAPPSVSPPAVLVIDDEDYVADMIASLLRLEGYVPTVAYNGRDGLRHAMGFRGRLIIVDIMMPYMSGIDLINEIKSVPEVARIPIILISAGARPRLAMPNVTFVAKPFDIERLLSVVVDVAGRPDSTPRDGTAEAEGGTEQ